MIDLHNNKQQPKVFQSSHRSDSLKVALAIPEVSHHRTTPSLRVFFVKSKLNPRKKTQKKRQ